MQHLTEMELDLIDEIRSAMVHAYCSKSRYALTAARTVMEDYFTILPLSASVKNEILRFYDFMKA